MASSRDAARLRQGLNPLLTTALGPFSNPSPAQQQHQGPQPTPISAVSMTSSHFLASSVQTPLQPYNPQEWANSPVTMPERYFSPAGDSSAVGASAGAPLPPPPYSPPRSQQPQHQQQQRPMSTAFEHFSNSSTPPPPLPRLPSGSNYHRPSPEQTTTSFPPPPGLVGRGASRERRFLSSLTRRREATDSHAASSPDMRQTPPAPLRISSGAASIHTPEPYRPASMVFEGQSGPPSARRAASTGAIETPTSAQSRSTSQTRWEPGMPVPPPPPGPPPTSSRSSSVQPMDQNQVPIISPPTRRPPPSSGSALGPVPPTPAGWIDSDSVADAVGRGRSPALKIDTEAAEQHGTAYDPNPSSSSANSLSRQKAVRHDKTIMQRRAESRSRHSARSSIDERTLSSNPENIVIPTEGEDGPARLLITKLTPKTGDSLNSHNSTPRASSKQAMTEAATPPFSPYQPKLAQRSAPIMGGSSVPKSLPTPPPQARSASGSRPREASRPPSRQPSRPPSAAASIPRHLVLSQSADQFAAAAIERFQAFAAKEALAESDADKVRLFTDFFVHESMIRRERYNAAIGAMGSEIFDLTRDLFQPLKSDRRQSAVSADEWTPATTTDASASHRGSVSSLHGDNGGPSNSEPTSAGVALSPTGPAAGTGTWASNYMPSLSPILSMSVSDNHENGSSRGRPPSRWFESTSQGEAARGFIRSKRESKYMGVPKEQWEESFTEGNDSHTATSERASSVDYPPEKLGLHEEMESTMQSQPAQILDDSVVQGSSPQRPDGRQLDVSRLVTMPPPYPRHHPALNNSHPELTAIRTSVRALSNVAELDSTREMFDFESSRRRDEFSKSSSERQKALRANLQGEISSGHIGYSDAAAIEADARTEEHTKKKELEKSEYEQFQSKVILPMNELLSNRISRATDLFEDLSRKLFDNGQNDADMPQEEGDDRPELLEKLTLLKWIFEARETLHKATFDILSDRNSRYRDVVLLPYQLSGNNEKLKSAEAFFAEDAAKREYAYAHEVLNRVREFRGVVEEAVGHGVAMQLSAFWDIAPPLSQVLESIPQDLSDFLVQIPPSEYEENPAYRDHPLQYLFSLLLHAEKSTYQFIESHTNLLCLLHEVKEAVVHAKARVLATQVEDAEGASICTEEREKRARSMRKTEERKLTEDLKEKVRVVQDQWRSGLGDAIVGVKARTGQWLLQTGGWDEALEDGGVGGA